MIAPLTTPLIPLTPIPAAQAVYNTLLEDTILIPRPQYCKIFRHKVTKSTSPPAPCVAVASFCMKV